MTWQNRTRRRTTTTTGCAVTGLVLIAAVLCGLWLVPWIGEVLR